MRLLLVEDNANVALAVAAALGAMGHVVEVVDQGRRALGAIKYFRPDAIILDVSLPDISGFQVAAFIRRDHPNLPIVFASGYDSYGEGMVAALALKNTAALLKPYAISELIETLDRLILARGSLPVA